MDIILLILLIIFCIITYFLLVDKKEKNLVYISLCAINFVLGLCHLYFNNKEKMTQRGGGEFFVNKNIKTKREKLLDKCGLPDNYSTSHCFNDSTHHTCCKLGKKAREYADKTGNPIGTASIRAFKEKFGREPIAEEKTGWCTCFGSKVCSNYADKFPSDTKIKFINNPKSKKEIRSAVPNKCEEYFRKKYSVQKHGTPGVYKKKGVTKIKRSNCEKKKQVRISIIKVSRHLIQQNLFYFYYTLSSLKFLHRDNNYHLIFQIGLQNP